MTEDFVGFVNKIMNDRFPCKILDRRISPWNKFFHGESKRRILHLDTIYAHTITVTRISDTICNFKVTLFWAAASNN
jgi:hypothetical protein